jgi:hypothetical protein
VSLGGVHLVLRCFRRLDGLILVVWLCVHSKRPVFVVWELPVMLFVVVGLASPLRGPLVSFVMCVVVLGLFVFGVIW